MAPFSAMKMTLRAVPRGVTLPAACIFSGASVCSSKVGASASPPSLCSRSRRFKSIATSTLREDFHHLVLHQVQPHAIDLALRRQHEKAIALHTELFLALTYSVQRG